MIPQLLLEEINMGEKNACDYYDKYGKAELEKALEELKKSDEEILNAYPLKDMQKEFVKKSLFTDSSKKSKYRTMRIFTLASAAVLAVFISLPVVMNTLHSNQSTSVTRVKGDKIMQHQMRLYRKSGSEAVLLKNGTKAKENDVIQITYVPGGYNYGLIFSVDGNGSVTRHFPENSWISDKLEKTGEEVPLSFSYALDDAPDFECFIFVASKEMFDMTDFGEGTHNETLSVEYLKKGTYLPEGCDGSIFVLNK